MPTRRKGRYAYLRDLRYKTCTPKWADLEEIDKIYRKARKLNLAYYKTLRAARIPRKKWRALYHVDHIIPIKGKNVCGLHVASNLRIILAHENLLKGNKMVESILA